MPRGPRFDQLSPEALDEAAASFERQAEFLRELAKLRRGERLTDLPRSSRPDNMTAAQLKRRGAAIARAAAERQGDALLTALAGSEWKSLRRYAKDRLGVSAGTFSGYKTGARACPARVADRVAADLNVPRSYWPAGVED